MVISLSYETGIILARIKAEGHQLLLLSSSPAGSRNTFPSTVKLAGLIVGQRLPSLLSAVLKARMFFFYVLSRKIKPLAPRSITVGVNMWFCIQVISKEM